MRRNLLIGSALAVLAVVGGVVAWSLRGDEQQLPTTDELLAEVEGRPLSPVELADQLEVGEMLCSLDDPVLGAVWLRVEPDQLPFHDVVVASLCPERTALYAARTGRLVTLTVDGIDTDTSGSVTTVERSTSTTGTTSATGESSDDSSPSDRSATTTTIEGASTPGDSDTENDDTSTSGATPTLPPDDELFTTTTGRSTSMVTLDPGT